MTKYEFELIFCKYINRNYKLDFVKHLNKLTCVPGVYRFNVNDEVFYIGYSRNLRDRIIDSFIFRCHNCHKNKITLQYIIAKNYRIANDIEYYYIELLKPIKNIDGKSKKIISIDPDRPLFCDPIIMELNF